MTLAHLACSTPPAEDGDDGPSTSTSGDGDPSDGGETEDSDPTDSTETGDGDPGVCGDGIVDPGEECDLGAQNSDSGACTLACTITVCGDGLVYEGFEECDDGNNDNTDECVLGCKLATCGDGFVQTDIEWCDDGNTDPTDGCGCCLPDCDCPDGIVGEGEQCDDGNYDDTDECVLCQVAFCGDGYIRAGHEVCDDGNIIPTDACTFPDCQPAACGDGFVYEGVEECDDGNLVTTDACPACTPAVCGDGFVWDGVEECDDGNNQDNDGCTQDCVDECSEHILVEDWNGWTYYAVPVVGTMTDANILGACQGCGLDVPCQATGECQYNDDVCVQTGNELICGGAFRMIAQLLCNNGGDPQSCQELWGIYQYMGGAWLGGCGVEQDQYCAEGDGQFNRRALCVRQ